MLFFTVLWARKYFFRIRIRGPINLNYGFIGSEPTTLFFYLLCWQFSNLGCLIIPLVSVTHLVIYRSVLYQKTEKSITYVVFPHPGSVDP
jgi:hypothetical protein